MTVAVKVLSASARRSKLSGNSDSGVIKQMKRVKPSRAMARARIAGASYARFSLSASTSSGYNFPPVAVQFNAYYNAVSTQNGLSGR